MKLGAYIARRLGIADRVRLSLSGRRWLWPSKMAPLGLSVAPFIVIIAPIELKEG